MSVTVLKAGFERCRTRLHAAFKKQNGTVHGEQAACVLTIRTRKPYQRQGSTLRADDDLGRAGHVLQGRAGPERPATADHLACPRSEACKDIAAVTVLHAFFSDCFS